jgi:ribA/ribD-fused uncharacterized protein
MKAIRGFFNEYRFLSNFHFCKIPYEGIVYPSSEHAYQAAKTLDPTKRQELADEPLLARVRELGNALDLRKDWEDVKVKVMKEICTIKFSQEPLRTMLLNTGNAELVEDNWWGDKFWGVCGGVGENNLGKILMDIRTKIRWIDMFSTYQRK